MKTLLTRTASGIVFLAIMIAGILWNQYSFALLFSVILAGTLNEYFNITAGKREAGKAKIPVKWFVLVLSVIVYLKSFVLSSLPASGLPDLDNKLLALFQVLLRLRDTNLPMNAIVPGLVFLIFAYELFTGNENPFANIGWNVTAIFWILVPVVLTNQLYFQHGGAFLLAVFALIWIYDSASYASGSLFGKHPLFPRVSPKKTIEGMIGGVFFTLLFAFFFNRCPDLGGYSNVEWLVIAVVIIFAATFGDLVESLLKRSLNLKDSGSIMPGHGGFLDRFDAYFFAVPFVVAILWMIAQVHNMLLIFDYLNK
jgi:phosphatidate cytidylyltransferase